jgi:hypothetical protein
MRKAALLAIFTAAAATAAAHAQSPDRVRLNFASPPSGFAAAVSQAPVGNWRQHVTVDERGRENGVGARVEGRALVDGAWRPVRLTVDCADGETGVYLNLDPATTRSAVRVSTAIDGARERSGSWTVCRTQDCIGLWKRGGVAMAQQLMEARELRLSVDHPGRADTPVVIDLSGAEAALAPVARQCGWPVRQEARSSSLR